MKKFLKIAGLILGGIVAVGVLALVAATLLGFAYGGIKQPSQVVSLQTAVCTNGDIEKYNSLVVTFPTTEEARDKKVADFVALAKDIKGNTDYADDPSCTYMVYGAAVQAGDVAAAEGAYKALETLHAQNAFPDNSIIDVSSLTSMKDRIEALNNPAEIGEDPLGSG